jgi:hypothetical protein
MDSPCVVKICVFRINIYTLSFYIDLPNSFTYVPLTKFPPFVQV